jgi:elongator complex protein 3
MRDIPAKFITGGLKDSLRDVVKKKLEEQGAGCSCIRCREYGHRINNGWHTGKPLLTRMDYKASQGQEIFLSFEDEMETLFGLLRLRIQDKRLPGLEYPPGKLALVRELHVYGPEVAIGRSNAVAVQHKGLGKLLLMEAERIACEEFGAPIIAVLSGVGARQYYRTDLGYELEAGYMVKRFKTCAEVSSFILPDSSSA